MTLARADVVGHRIHAQQLDRPEADRAVIDAAIFDLGVQDTGTDGASWALANRGVPLARPTDLEAAPEVALVWTLRSAPHYYRRAELADVLVATSPYSEADAVKRVVGAGKPLKEAGISTLEGLTEVATQMRRIVTTPMVKGEVSTRLSQQLTPPYLRECRPCNAVHSWEVPFRVGALYGGLELEPGTSPPVLRRIPDWGRRRPGPAADPLAAPAHLQPIRRYLELCGPATPHDVAGFLDAPVAAVKQHWPEDAVRVQAEERAAWQLGELTRPKTAGLVRLLGPFDLLLQGRDRDLLVPARDRHAELWPVLGRPGAVLVGTDIAGWWRPRASGRSLNLRVRLWQLLSAADRARVAAEGEKLAAHRGTRLGGVEWLE